MKSKITIFSLGLLLLVGAGCAQIGKDADTPFVDAPVDVRSRVIGMSIDFASSEYEVEGEFVNFGPFITDISPKDGSEFQTRKFSARIKKQRNAAKIESELNTDQFSEMRDRHTVGDLDVISYSVGGYCDLSAIEIIGPMMNITIVDRCYGDGDTVFDEMLELAEKITFFDSASE